jgi:hypothetical protein
MNSEMNREAIPSGSDIVLDRSDRMGLRNATISYPLRAGRFFFKPVFLKTHAAVLCVV